jgi:hypothetical protein
MKNGPKTLTHRVGNFQKRVRLSAEEAKAKDERQRKWLNALQIEQVAKATVKNG